jgi:hypothetical protein
VVDSEPPSEPELDPELPPSVELGPEPSGPELVEMVVPPPPSGPSVDGWVTAVVSLEPSRSLPDEPPLEDVSSRPPPSCDPDPPEPDSPVPSPRLCG